MAEDTSSVRQESPWGLKRAVILALLVCCCLVAFWRGMKASRSALPSPEVQSGLVADPLRLNFGEVWENARFEWDVPLTNIADHDIEITKFSSSCDCSAIKPESLLLRMGEKVDVKLTLDLRAKHFQDIGIPVRDFEIGLQPEIRGGSGHPGWTLRGRVRTDLSFSERSIDFGDELVVGQPFPSRTITIKGLVPLAYLEAGCDDSLVITRITRPDNSRPEFQLDVKLTPSMPVGKFARRVRIQAVAKDGKKMPLVWLPIEGEVGADVQSLPAVVHFGAGAADSEMRETVVIRSFSRKATVVEAVEVPPDSGLTVIPVSGPQNDGLRYVVTQRVREQGHKETVFKFSVRVAGREKIVIPVKATYYGVARNKWQ